MRPFRSQHGRLVADLEPEEAALLRQVVSEVRDLLSRGADGGSQDWAGGECGTEAGTEADSVRARLLPDGHRSDPDLASDYRSLTEAGLRQEKLADADRVLDSLGPAGGRVELDENGAEAWLRTINDVRLTIGVRLDVQETDDPLDRAERTGDPRWAAYSWLTAVQGLLVDAMASDRR